MPAKSPLSQCASGFRKLAAFALISATLTTVHTASAAVLLTVNIRNADRVTITATTSATPNYEDDETDTSDGMLLSGFFRDLTGSHSGEMSGNLQKTGVVHSYVYYNRWDFQNETGLRIYTTYTEYEQIFDPDERAFTGVAELNLEGLKDYLPHTGTHDLYTFGDNGGTLIGQYRVVSSYATSIPEPSSFALIGLSAVGFYLLRRRTRA